MTGSAGNQRGQQKAQHQQLLTRAVDAGESRETRALARARKQVRTGALARARRGGTAGALAAVAEAASKHAGRTLVALRARVEARAGAAADRVAVAAAFAVDVAVAEGAGWEAVVRGGAGLALEARVLWLAVAASPSGRAAGAAVAARAGGVAVRAVGPTLRRQGRSATPVACCRPRMRNRAEPTYIIVGDARRAARRVERRAAQRTRTHARTSQVRQQAAGQWKASGRQAGGAGPTGRLRSS